LLTSPEGILLPFNDLTVLAGTSEVSNWIRLLNFFNFHAINGKFSGAGSLDISYEIAAVPENAYAYDFGNILTDMTVAGGDSPFYSEMDLGASRAIRYTATETLGVNDITGLSMYFLQTGR